MIARAWVCFAADMAERREIGASVNRSISIRILNFCGDEGEEVGGIKA